jgi:hypothetical protein
MKLKQVLQERMDTGFGLLEDLPAILTVEQYERINPFKQVERNEKLLHEVKKLRYVRFMQGLIAIN